MKEKDKKETQETEEKPQASNDPARKEERISDLSWRKWEAPRGTRMEKYKKRNGNGRLSNRQNGIPPSWEKRQRGRTAKQWDRERRDLSMSRKRQSAIDFQRN